MANHKGNHQQLTQIKKGQVLNPNGRPRLPEELKKIRRKYSKDKIQAMIAQCLDKKVTDLEKILKNKDNKIIDHLIGRVVLKGIVYGDHQRFNFILDRMIGKVTETKEIKTAEPFIVTRSDGTTIEMGSREREDEDEY